MRSNIVCVADNRGVRRPRRPLRCKRGEASFREKRERPVGERVEVQGHEATVPRLCFRFVTAGFHGVTVGFQPVTVEGSYTYARNGEPVAVEERWERVTTSARETIVRSTRRTANGTTINVEAACVDGLVSSATIEWVSTGPVLRRTVRYDLANDTFRWSLGHDDADRDDRDDCDGAVENVEPEIALPPGALLSPLLRVFQGPVIAAVARIGMGAVVVPFLHDPSDRARLLSPTIEERTARLVEAGVGGVDSSRAIDMYTYESSVYDGNACFWLDRETKHLVRYRFRQGADQWEVSAVV